MRENADVGKSSLTVVVCPAADGPLGDGAARDDGGGGVRVLSGLYAAGATSVSSQTGAAVRLDGLCDGWLQHVGTDYV